MDAFEFEELDALESIDSFIDDPGQQVPAIRKCLHCQTRLVRKKDEIPVSFSRRNYCNSRCIDDRKKANRPSDWEKNHREARKHRKDNCEACGFNESLHAHHIDGNPKNNIGKNIQTLCTWCHNFTHAIAARIGLETPGQMPTMGHNSNE